MCKGMFKFGGGGGAVNSRSVASMFHAAWLILLGVACVAPYEVTAETDSAGAKLLFILDASGSMWGIVEGKEKIVVAREVIANLINELPEGTQVGLEAYGHRSKGDCNDIEMMVPVGASDKAAVIEQINAINPKGKTPITKSFEAASERLKGVEEETTVVLISDGKETCQGDPCMLVGSLRKQGINVRVHVIGFDVSQEERDQLVCIADAGEGKYFSADNADQLATALTEVKREIVAAPKGEEPQQPEKRVVKIGTGTIRILDTKDGVDILDQESGKEVGHCVNVGCKSGKRPVQVPPGAYKLKFPNFEVDGIEVKAGEEVVVEKQVKKLLLSSGSRII